MNVYILVLFVCLTANIAKANTNSTCICTTVPCPHENVNTVIMGNGYATIEYIYHMHETYEVVVSASGIVEKGALDHGTETTSCTQKYSRTLEHDGKQNCDAGHILANRLGGYGNIPVNIFPQNASMNRGSYAQYEGLIYNCIEMGKGTASLSWEFLYETNTNTMPYGVIYKAVYDEQDYCNDTEEYFQNV